jgi:hypothetical protein
MPIAITNTLRYVRTPANRLGAPNRVRRAFVEVRRFKTRAMRKSVKSEYVFLFVRNNL